MICDLKCSECLQEKSHQITHFVFTCIRSGKEITMHNIKLRSMKMFFLSTCIKIRGLRDCRKMYYTRGEFRKDEEICLLFAEYFYLFILFATLTSFVHYGGYVLNSLCTFCY